jgi:hypothetical protein
VRSFTKCTKAKRLNECLLSKAKRLNECLLSKAKRSKKIKRLKKIEWFLDGLFKEIKNVII